MTQSLPEARSEAVRVAAAADLELDRVAWNTPRRPGEPALETCRGGLGWAAFSAEYFPRTRRHHLPAIVAYGAYRLSEPADEQAASRATAPPR